MVIKPLILGLIAFLLVSCASTKALKSDFMTESLFEKARKDEVYLKAQLHAYANEVPEAIKILDQFQEKEDHKSLNYELMLALLKAQDGQIDDAGKAYSKLLQKYPNNQKVLADAAQFYYNTGDQKKSLEFFSLLTEKYPSEGNYWIYKGLLALEEGDLALAWDAFDYIKKNLKEARHLGSYYIGKLLQISHNHKGAEKEYSECINIKPAETDCLLALADMDYKKGKIKSARAKIEKHIVDFPDHEPVVLFKKLIGWDMRENNPDAAITHLQRLEKIQPGDLAVKRQLARLLLNKKEKFAVEQRLKIIAESKKANLVDQMTYLKFLESNQDFKKALEHISLVEKNRDLEVAVFIEKLTLLSKANPEINNEIKFSEDCEKKVKSFAACEQALAINFLNRNNADAAIKRLKRYKNKYKENLSPSLWYTYAQLYEEIGRPKRASKEVDNLLKNYSSFAPALNYKAYAWAKKGLNIEEAEGLVLRALAAEPSNGHYLDTYGLILHKQAKYEQALVVLKSAAKILPNEPEVLEHLADSYQALNQRDFAVKFYELAINLYKGENQERVGGKIAQIRSEQNNKGSKDYSRAPASE